MTISVRLIGSLSLLVSVCACAPAMGPTDGGGDASAADTPPAGDSAMTSGGVPAEIIRTCSLANVCSFGPVVGAPFDRCVESLVRDRLAGGLGYGAVKRQQVDRLVRCGTSSSTCEAFVSCARMNTAACTVMGGRCEGQVAVYCSQRTDNVPEVTDCAALGLTCDAGRCVGPAGAPACMSTSDAPLRCDGTALVRCSGPAGGMGTELREPCPAGSACQEAGRSFRCLPSPVVSCTTPGVRCEGTTLVSCLPLETGMIELRQECGNLGMACGTVTGGSRDPQCVPAATECTAPPTTTTMPSSGRCDGADIVACVLGRTTRIRCADFGRTTCGMVTTFPICM